MYLKNINNFTTMKVLKGTYRVSLWDFINLYSNNIKRIIYTDSEAMDCIEMLNSGILQFLKIYIINGELKSCCKLMTIAKDFINNKFADLSGRFYNEYSDEERFFLSHVVKFDYMEITSDNDDKIDRLIELIDFRS